MLLLTPVILLVLFGSLFLTQSMTVPPGLRPFRPTAR